FRCRTRLRAALHQRSASAIVRRRALPGAGGPRRAMRSTAAVPGNCAAARAAERRLRAQPMSRSLPFWDYASHCGQFLQTVIPTMIGEEIATAGGQIKGKPTSTPITTVRTRRVLCICAKRQPATPIGDLRLAPSSGGLILQRKATHGYSPFGCSIDQGEATLAARQTLSHNPTAASNAVPLAGRQ